jgi:hypothetical protein
MPKATVTLSPVPSVSSLHNLSAGDLADELGALKADSGSAWRYRFESHAGAAISWS